MFMLPPSVLARGRWGPGSTEGGPTLEPPTNTSLVDGSKLKLREVNPEPPPSATGEMPWGNLGLVGDCTGGMANKLDMSRVCSMLGGAQGEERRRGRDGVLGLGLERGLKAWSLEPGGWGEK